MCPSQDVMNGVYNHLRSPFPTEWAANTPLHRNSKSVFVTLHNVNLNGTSKTSWGIGCLWIQSLDLDCNCYNIGIKWLPDGMQICMVFKEMTCSTLKLSYTASEKHKPKNTI